MTKMGMSNEHSDAWYDLCKQMAYLVRTVDHLFRQFPRVHDDRYNFQMQLIFEIEWCIVIVCSRRVMLLCFKVHLM